VRYALENVDWGETEVLVRINPMSTPYGPLDVREVGYLPHGLIVPKSETAKKYAEAKKLLEDVIAKHPKTPWADLAQDTLDRGFSVKLNEWHHNPKYADRWQFVPKY